MVFGDLGADEMNNYSNNDINNENDNDNCNDYNANNVEVRLVAVVFGDLGADEINLNQ